MQIEVIEPNISAVHDSAPLRLSTAARNAERDAVNLGDAAASGRRAVDTSLIHTAPLAGRVGRAGGLRKAVVTTAGSAV